MKKISVLLLLVCMSCSKFKLNNVSELPSFLKSGKYRNQDCIKNIELVRYELKDLKNHNFNVYWSNETVKPCDNPGYPKIMIKHPSVKKWVQVIVVDIPYTKGASLDKDSKGNYLYRGWNWNLGHDPDNEWFYLDVTKKERREKSPYYAPEIPHFHDSPLWGPINKYDPRMKREWTAYLYGLTEASLEKKPIVAVKWGFKQIKGKIKPITIKPQKTDLERWELFIKSQK